MDVGVVAWPGRTVGPHGAAAIGLAWGPWTLGLDAGGVLPSTLVDLGGDRTEATIDAGLRVGWRRPAGGPAVELGPGWAWERFYEAGALVDAGSLPTLTAGARWRFQWADWSVAPGLTGAYTLADTHVHVGDATTTLSPWRVGLLVSAGWSR